MDKLIKLMEKPLKMQELAIRELKIWELCLKMLVGD
jgi:hypothetical protein